MKLYNFDKFNESNIDIESICKKYSIRNWTIIDGLVNVEGDVNIYDRGITKLPLSFREVIGSFYCNKNKLTSLEGSPKKVSGDFWCFYNQLTSLEGSPERVGGHFDCSYNKLTSLEGSPQKVDGYFSCSVNNLTSLEGSPKKVSGSFYCSFNKLITLVGGPKEVWGNYWCIDNLLTDVRGFPEYYRGNVLITKNPVFEIICLFGGVNKDIIIETLNDYNVIKPGNKVNLQLLKYSFDELEIVMPEIEYIEGYEII